MLWLCALAFAQAPPPPEPPPEANPFGTGRGVALGGLTLGIAGNLVDFGGALVSLGELDPESGVLSPEGFALERPFKAVGAVALHGIGAPTMAAGTLQMRRANKDAGVRHTAAWGRMALGLGLVSAAANTTAFLIDSPRDADRQLTSNTVGRVGVATGVASYGLSVVQYMVSSSRRPARAEARSGTGRRSEPTFAVGPNGPAGVALCGTW